MRWSRVGSFAVVLLAPSVAQASTTFPPVLADAWELERLPSVGGAKGCLLCHATDLGVTVTTPFGKAVDAAGTAKRDVNSFVRALNALRSNEVDSDKDGVSDYEELAIDETNPNDRSDFVEPEPEPGSGGAAGAGGVAESGGQDGHGGNGEEPEPPDFVFPELPRLPEHGCSFHDRVTGSPHASWFALMLIVGALRRHRRSRSRIRFASRAD